MKKDAISKAIPRRLSSCFRMENYGLKDEDEISNHIRQKCTFKFNEIVDSVERVRFEHFATPVLMPTLNMKLKQ
jgi:hypothetical protein